jgi:hypothetical protein
LQAGCICAALGSACGFGGRHGGGGSGVGQVECGGNRGQQRAHLPIEPLSGESARTQVLISICVPKITVGAMGNLSLVEFRESVLLLLLLLLLLPPPPLGLLAVQLRRMRRMRS